MTKNALIRSEQDLRNVFVQILCELLVFQRRSDYGKPVSCHIRLRELDIEEIRRGSSSCFWKDRATRDFESGLCWTKNQGTACVLQKVGTNGELLGTVNRRNLSWHDEERESLFAVGYYWRNTPGSKRKGRLRTVWMDHVKDWTAMTL